jgi:hypothetical protein
VRAFVASFDSGSFAELDNLFADEPAFQWYSTPSPGRRFGASAKNRSTLIPYFRRRRAAGDRFRLIHFHWNGRSAHWSNFDVELLRRGLGGNSWFEVPGKGATVCDSGRASFIVLTLGSRIRR